MTFDRNSFSKELTSIIADELKKSAESFKDECIRALAIDCYPWNRSLELCFLTAAEDSTEKLYGKWSMGDWKYYSFTKKDDTPWPAAQKLRKELGDYYEEMSTEDRGEEATDIIIRGCARALLREEIKDALKIYTLTKDFEVYVNDPDDPEEKNYCDYYKL